ncbi:MAG: DNA mismatch repair endonuclease MutL [Chloroflexota bacterium]|nr:DNA mismatch repair endonuclease MutL [Chloroflexota bacterium]
MPIRVLDPEVAARIAAGEVVERPASVVKELVENALDAGATQVVVEVVGGGMERIRVSDDGVGIPQADVPLLFQRHATSKLASAKDLEAIATLGFRGEALYSIAQVSWVSLLTRHRDEEQGTLVEVREGAVLRREPAGARVGTTLTVRGLFRNVPARRKFLRSPSAEAARCQQVVCAYVLAFPQVRFTLQVDGRTVLTAPGNGNLRDAVGAVYGSQVAQALVEVQGEAPERGWKIWGLVSPPDLHRSHRGNISIIVNRRPVQARALAFAVEEAYTGLLPQERHPLAVVHLTLPSEQVDANVHPSKAEVRIAAEGEVAGLLQRTVREAVVARSAVPQVAVPLLRPEVGPAPPLGGRGGGGTVRGRGEAPAPTAGVASPPAPALRVALPALRPLGQMGACYIVAEGAEGLYLIDQHAAHERVLFERVWERLRRREPWTQGLLEPVVVELSPPQAQALADGQDAIAQAGWQVEPFGERAVLVRGMPAPLVGKPPRPAFLDFLDALLGDDLPQGMGMEARVAAVVACHSAVTAGMLLSPQEMASLLEDLGRAEDPYTCPHGRPTLVLLSRAYVEKEFRRR